MMPLECTPMLVDLIDAVLSSKRNFKFVTMLGFASTVICTWEGLLVYGSTILFAPWFPQL